MSVRQQQAAVGTMWLLTIIFIGLNLRPFLTASGPLAADIIATSGMSLASFSWLTLLPLVMFGVGTWLAPTVLRLLGARPAMVIALLLLALGCVLRLVAALPWLLLLTAALCGLGVALVQGILPGLVKRHSPQRVTFMMGAYSAAMMAGGALGAQLSPLAVSWGLSWQAALAMWALPVLLALWLVSWQMGRIERWERMQRNAAADTAMAASTSSASSTPSATAWLLRRRRSWWLMLSFGLMNGGYVSMVAWLAPHYQSLGWSAAQSGALIAVVSLAQAAAALLLPMLAAGQQDRRPWIWLTLGFQVCGFAALATAPLAAPFVLATVLGIGIGGCFPFFMIVALDHLRQPVQAGALNAFMQGGGFILSALAPWVMAGLHQSSGSFAAGWLMQMTIALLVALMVWRLDPVHYARDLQAPAN